MFGKSTHKYKLSLLLLLLLLLYLIYTCFWKCFHCICKHYYLLW